MRRTVTFRLPEVVLQIIEEIARESGAHRSQVICYAINQLLGDELAPKRLLHVKYGCAAGSWRDIEAATLRVKRELYS